MRYFVADLRLPEPPVGRNWLQRLFSGPPAVAPKAPRERMGGAPLGLAAQQWPLCADCGHPQTFLAQFEHHPERLDLGRTGRVLFVFQCDRNPGGCETWDFDAGANACFVVEPEALSDSETLSPDPETPVEKAVHIVGWLEWQDDVRDSDAPAFFNEAMRSELSDEAIDGPRPYTRLGGVPFWVQSADENPGEGWRFIGQLDGSLAFVHPPAKPMPEWITPAEAPDSAFACYADDPNFGDAGIAYLWVKPGEGTPKAGMFWQCY